MTRVLKPLDTAKTYLVTGAAGFIGFHLSKRLLDEGCNVLGLDNLNDYYDVNLKKARLAILKKHKKFTFVFANLEDRKSIERLFDEHTIHIVVNLAAQAGVRYSLENPYVYVDSNIVGFLNILEACRHHAVEHLVYASSSSVYGANEKTPFSTRDHVDHPISLYAATKRANELMAHVYSHLYSLPATGLRFFTVYGPWGRPDMALFLFTKAILNEEPIQVFNYGKMERDFTYIDDIIEGVVRVIPSPPEPNPGFEMLDATPDSSYAPFRVYNIGNNRPAQLMDFIRTLEKHLRKKARVELLPLQPGDVPRTVADVDSLERDICFSPRTSIDQGIQRFVEWFRGYYGV